MEDLETRVVLYSASGNAWPNPQIITISFMPDGTPLGGNYTSNLFSTFNSNPNLAGRWQDAILQAAQAWAQQANINFTVVPDDGTAEGGGPDQQGDPTFGDIRIGGYNFGFSALGMATQPPPVNNYSGAGDIDFNTAQAFHINTTYDLFTVAMHEFGHTLGLNHSNIGISVMYPTYNGLKHGLSYDDIAGIEAIYGGPRAPDIFNSGGQSNGTLGTAATIATPNLTDLFQNMDITQAGQSEYFKFTAPAGSSSTLALNVQTAGLSLLAPKVTVYAANGTTQLATASGAGLYGQSLLVNVPGIAAGQAYYVKVQGADNTQMGTGRYALGFDFSNGAPPTEPSPVVEVPDGNPVHGGGGDAQNAPTDNYAGASPVILGISPDNGVSSQDGITNDPRITIKGTAPAMDTVTIYCDGQPIGQTVAGDDNTWTFDDTASPLTVGSHSFTAVATDPSGYATDPSASFDVVIDTHTPAPPVLGDIAPDTGMSQTDGITDANRPTFSGTTEPFGVVDLYANGCSIPFGTTEADINGNWSFTVGQRGQITDPMGEVERVFPQFDVLPGSAQDGPPGTFLPDGTYQVTATTTDIAGTVGPPSAPLTIVIDSQRPQPPSVTGVSPAQAPGPLGAHTTASATPTITGSAMPGESITVLIDQRAAGTVTTASDGSWTFVDTSVPLSNGIHWITATAEDVAGNVSLQSAPFGLLVNAVTPPVIAGVVPTDGRGRNPDGLSLIGTAPAGDQVQVYLGGVLIGTTRADHSGGWSLDYAPSPADAAGTLEFSAVSSDRWGNASVPSPTFSLDLGGGLAASTSRYDAGVLYGRATPGSQVSIIDGDVVIGVVTADASGDWQFAPALERGRHTIMVDASNGSGKTSLLSGPLIVRA